MSIRKHGAFRRIAATTLAAASAGVIAGLGTAPAHAGQKDVRHLENFDVSADHVVSTRIASTFQVQVCATNVPAGETVRVSWDAWELNFTDGTSESPVSQFGHEQHTTYPVEGDGYEAFLAQGECATGDLVFPVTARVPDGLSYTSSLGDEATF